MPLCSLQYNDILQNNKNVTLSLKFNDLSDDAVCHYAECHFSNIMLSAIMLSVSDNKKCDTQHEFTQQDADCKADCHTFTVMLGIVAQCCVTTFSITKNCDTQLCAQSLYSP